MDQVLICIRLKWKLHLWICETKADTCRILHLMRDFCVCTADCDAMKRRPRRKLRESLWHPDQKSSETLPADSYGGKWAAERWCHLKKWNSCHTCSLLCHARVLCSVVMLTVSLSLMYLSMCTAWMTPNLEAGSASLLDKVFDPPLNTLKLRYLFSRERTESNNCCTLTVQQKLL